MKTRPNDPAQPTIMDVETDMGNVSVRHIGLTKREYFSALNLQGFLSSRKEVLVNLSNETLERYAEMSVRLADLLTKALNKEKQ